MPHVTAQRQETNAHVRDGDRLSSADLYHLNITL